MPGLVVNSLDLRSADGRFDFSLVEGFYELPSFDGGENTIITGAPGEEDEEAIARRLGLKFDGWIHGTGGTMAERLEDFLAACSEWRTAVAPMTAGILDGPVSVELTAPYMGLGTGEVATIDAKYSGATWERRVAGASRHLIFTMVAVGDPPDPPAWSIGIP